MSFSLTLKVWSLAANKKFAGCFSGNGMMHSVLDVQRAHIKTIISSAKAFVNNIFPFVSKAFLMVINSLPIKLKNPPA